jgi:hypothetical protein
MQVNVLQVQPMYKSQRFAGRYLIQASIKRKKEKKTRYSVTAIAFRDMRATDTHKQFFSYAMRDICFEQLRDARRADLLANPFEMPSAAL